MIRALSLILCLTLAACAAERLAPGPGPTAPRFIDQGHWVSDDGYILGMSEWQAENPKTVIVALHGMNDYGRFVEGAAKYWQARGITTYAYDQRGFGRTEGNGRWAGHDRMADDARTFLNVVRARHPNARILLLGESMGGAVAMLAASKDDKPVADGLILVSPALWGWSNLDLVKRSALWAMMQIAPGGRLSGRGISVKPSDNEKMLIALGRDPFVIKSTRVDAVHGLVTLMDEAWKRAAEIKLPTLILYAPDDEIVPAKPIEEAAKKIAGVRVVCFADGFHMLLRDLKAKRTWDVIDAFAHDRPAEAAGGCG